MLDRALEEMQKKESKIMSPSLRLQDQLVDVRRWHPRNRSSRVPPAYIDQLVLQP